MRKAQHATTDIRKGITTWPELEAAFHYYQKTYGSVFLETDMRALYNPTRMEVIAATAQKLLEVLQRLCPACDTPGFSVKERQSGLPCSLCHRPTSGILLEQYQCQRCGHQEALYFPQQKQAEDPQFCDFCNP
jgi:DNA-directed RNA polymerase subunit M/transcription elongation factor TFIIS